MDKNFSHFEGIVREAHLYVQYGHRHEGSKPHPFEARGIHPEVGNAAKDLFDDGHYSEATLASFKYLEEMIAHISDIDASGSKLIMQAFDSKQKKIILARDKEVQKGFAHLFAGAFQAIRNPRAHKTSETIKESREECLEHISLASFLLRLLEKRLPLK